MNERVAMTTILALAVLLLAAGLPGTTPGTAAAAQPPSASGMAGQSLPAREMASGHAVQPGTSAGGVYQLTVGSASGGVEAAAFGVGSKSVWTGGGGGYRLDALSVVRGTGTPCCCVHLPCVAKKLP